MKFQNEFAHTNNHARTMVGAMTSCIDIRIGIVMKESVAGPIISFVVIQIVRGQGKRERTFKLAR